MATVSKAFLKTMMDAETPEPSGEAYAARWDPEENPFIVGELTSVEEVSTSNGLGTRITINDQGPDKLGAVSFFANTVIQSAWGKQEPKIGEIVGVKYLGEVESKNGRTYKNYLLKVDRPELTLPLPNTQDDVEDPFLDE